MLPLLLALLSPGSLACDGDVTARVVGWSADGNTALVRSSSEGSAGQSIALFLLDLSTSKVTRTLPIMELGEGVPERGRRWAAAEAELTSTGFTIHPTSEPVALDAAVEGATLSWSSRDAAGTVFWDLAATRAGHSVTLARNVWLQAPTPNHWESVLGPWASPGGRWLVFLKQGCVGQDFTVLSTDYVRGALDGAK